MLSYMNFGKLTRRNLNPPVLKTRNIEQQGIAKTEFTIQPWASLLDCGLAKLAERNKGRVYLNEWSRDLVWVDLSTFFTILETVIERILANPDLSIHCNIERDEETEPYQSLVLNIQGLEQTELDIEMLFAPLDSNIGACQYFLYARQFMQEAGGKLIYRSDLRKTRKILFLFPIVE